MIDGQQRLTTLVMLLGYLRAWAASQPGLASLEERVTRMLHIPADPLNPSSRERCADAAAAHAAARARQTARANGSGRAACW